MTLIYEGRALDEGVEDLRCLPVERLRVEDLDDKRLGRAERKPRHAVAVADIGQAVDPRIHVAAVEIREAEYDRALIVERVPVANCCSVQLNLCHFPCQDLCWRLTLIGQPSYTANRRKTILINRLKSPAKNQRYRHVSASEPFPPSGSSTFTHIIQRTMLHNVRECQLGP